VIGVGGWAFLDLVVGASIAMGEQRHWIYLWGWLLNWWVVRSWFPPRLGSFLGGEVGFLVLIWAERCGVLFLFWFSIFFLLVSVEGLLCIKVVFWFGFLLFSDQRIITRWALH
jgi:hypothetical protein